MAEAASGRKTRMLTSVSHDIRSPVNAINLIAAVIHRAAGDPARASQVPRMAERLQESTSSLLELISDVLDMAQLDAGAIECRPVTFRLDELVGARCGTLAPQAEAKGLVLAAVHSREIVVSTDRTKLDRMLTNLVTNAIKFTETGSVTVTASVDGEGRAQVEVRDTGPGIAPHEREHIFDEFARGAQAGSGAEPGWGMGLAICRRLAKVLDAELTMDSVPGKGSTFRIRLGAGTLADAAPGAASRGAWRARGTDGGRRGPTSSPLREA
jgi:signal transduction histidine kinase